MKYLHTDAELSPCGRYRYWLSRRLAMGERAILFVGLNPSTADASQDDPTIRRCVGFARSWGFDWLFMGNVNAFRSTDPNGLPADPIEAVGLGNQEALTWMSQKAEIVVAAWGANPLNRYAHSLADRIVRLPNARHLGLTKAGHPKHPLYLAASTPLQLFGVAAPEER
jgi:hypothetical protein